MGFTLTLLFITLSLISPAAIFPEMAQWRIQLWIALVGLALSVPAFIQRRLWRVPHVTLLTGLTFAIAISMVANHWAGGVIVAFNRFLPSAAVLLLIIANVTSVSRLRTLVIVLVLITSGITLAGSLVYGRDPTSKLILMDTREGDVQTVQRFRGMGVIEDPNDTAQLLVSVIPFCWTGWKRRTAISKLLGAVAPTALLLYGVYMTHSRGAVVGLVVILIVAAKDRFGGAKAVLFAPIAASVLFAANFTAGRHISLEQGADRLGAWSEGLLLLKSSPLFGIGFGGFTDHYEITAHNSFLLCASELGLFGYFFWLALIVCTFAALNHAVRGDTTVTSDGGGQNVVASGFQEVDDRARDWAGAARIALLGFLTCAWFLSRAYVLTFYIVLGTCVAAAYVSQREIKAGLFDVGRMLRLAAVLEPVSIGVLYVLVRMRAVG